jgi:SAM-dependent methyltransferase
MELYDKMARYYDLIYNGAYDTEFYLREAKDSKGPVLEVACGTGRILLDLLSDGIDIAGLDSSKGMLEELEAKAKGRSLRPGLFHGDMRDFLIKRKFKLIMIPYRSILHLTNKDKKKAIANMASHLEKGGKLIIHSYNLDSEHKKLVKGFHPIDHEDCVTKDGNPYRVDWYMEYHPEEDSGDYRIDLQFQGKLHDEHAFSMKLYFIGQGEMEAMLKDRGFKDIRLYCGFDYSSFDKNCREMIWIARI